MTYTFAVIDEVTGEAIDRASETIDEFSWIFDALREFGRTPAGREWSRRVRREARAKRQWFVVHNAADRTESRRKRAGRRRTKRLAAARGAR